MDRIPNKPKRIDLKLGFVCNNLCIHCVQGDRRLTFGDKSLIQLKDELREGRKFCDEAVFTGGEPTLHKNFLELVCYAKDLGYRLIQIQSNCRLFAYRDFCVKTINCGANLFSPALHGYVAKIHDYITGTPHSFEQTVLGIFNIKSLGKNIAMNTVISKINYRSLPELAKLLINLDVDQFQLAFPHPTGRAGQNFNLVIPRLKNIMPYVKRALEIGIKANKTVMTEGIPLCFMSGFESYIAEIRIPKTKVFDADYEIEDYNYYRITKAKTKGAKCTKCCHYEYCEGPWKEYPEHFGWSEFIPVKSRGKNKKSYSPLKVGEYLK